MHHRRRQLHLPRVQLLLRRPQVHGVIYHGYIDEGDDAEDGGKAAGSIGRARRVGTHDQVGDVDGEGDQHRGQAGLPAPVYSPYWFGPDGACDEDDVGDLDAELGGGLSQTVPALGAGPQVQDAGDEDDGVPDERGDGRGDMEIEDALHHPHFALRRHVDEHGEQGGDHEEGETGFDDDGKVAAHGNSLPSVILPPRTRRA